MKGLWRFLKKRSEVIFILLAIALFAAGVATFLLRRAEETRLDAGSDTPRSDTGPSPGESIPAYIEARKGDLSKRAQQQPNAGSLAVISFGAYLKPTQIDALLATQKLSSVEVQWRLPLPGELPQAVAVESTVAEAIGKAITTVSVELAVRAQDLDNYAKEASLPEERTQFAADAKGARQLVEALKSDPAIVHAVVVQGTNAALLEISKVPEVRLVDLGPAGSTRESHTFPGLRPEQTEVA